LREENKARLDDMMALHEKRLAEMRRRHELARELHDVFIEEFERLVDGAIRPTMNEVGGALRKHGHEYQISITQGYTDSRGHIRRTQITMLVYPAGIPRSLFSSTSTPYVAFAADWLDKRVVVLQYTLTPLGASRSALGNGKSGRRAAHTLKQLTRSAVEREIVDVLTEVFGREQMLG